MLNKNIFLMVLLLPMLFGTLACDDQHKHDASAEVKQTYTCPMHPQIVQDKPGTCPVCGMDLVVFDRNNTDATLTLNANQIALANITTVKVGAGSMSNTRQLNGRLVTDPSQTAYVASRVAGRLEKLYIKETGVNVKKGQPLYTIYSEELAALQQEYLLAVAQLKEFTDDKKFAEIERAARQKLKLYDQTEAQIERLVSAQKTSPYVTYTAAISGVVSELTVGEGQYVGAGASIMRIEDYGNLWVEADLYPAEAKLVKRGQQVKVVVTGWENEPQTTTVEFVNPSLQEGGQLMQVRGSVKNPNGQWQAGLQAVILLPGAVESAAVTVPIDAVIRGAGGSHVWISNEEGKFEPRAVVVGTETADRVEVKEGLDEGEEVVITGAYLLNSEYILKKGADPMAAHGH